MNPPGLIWDACSLLTLSATRRIEEILGAFGCPCYVVKQVRIEEVVYLRPLPEEDPQRKLISVDLSPIVQVGLLNGLELNETEIETFVRFAEHIDDGEARTGAIAFHRGYGMVTDDRRTMRLLHAQAPPVRLWTTPQWLHTWVELQSIDAEQVSEIIRRIDLCANYLPRRIDPRTNQSDPLYEWWLQHLRREEG